MATNQAVGSSNLSGRAINQWLAATLIKWLSKTRVLVRNSHFFEPLVNGLTRDVGGCVNPHLNGGEIPWGSVATSWRKLYEWLSVPQGASLVSSGLLLDPQTAISIQGRQELATHSSLLLAQIQKYTIPQNALRHLSAGFRRHLQTMSTTMSSTRSTSCTREKSDPPRKRGIAFFSVT